MAQDALVPAVLFAMFKYPPLLFVLLAVFGVLALSLLPQLVRTIGRFAKRIGSVFDGRTR